MRESSTGTTTKPDMGVFLDNGDLVDDVGGRGVRSIVGRSDGGVVSLVMREEETTVLFGNENET
jgi:hypothetical protein